MTLKEKYGFLRSWIIYYGKPFNRQRLRKFYSQFISSGDLVFDIGAHLGNRSEVFLDLGARVIAIEPQPSCLEFLQKKFKGNNRFTLLPVLVSNEDQVLDFYVNSISPTISTARGVDWQKNINKYSVLKTHWNSTIRVPSTTVDNLIKKYGLPGFCKIDTEGFEYEVVSGLSQPINIISVEYLAFDKDLILKCVDKIGILGNYIINFSPGESQKWLWKEWKTVEQVKSILKMDAMGYRFGDFYFKLIV